MNEWKELEGELLDYWLGSIDNSTELKSGAEPFQTHVGRWCGKDSAIDDDIRTRFEAPYLEATGSLRAWNEVADEAGKTGRGSLALTILLDQMPRNMYRGTPKMYAHDALALSFAFRAIDRGLDAELSLPERMFLYLPLMHAEDLTVQWIVEALFEKLLHAAKEVSPHSVGYYESALGSGRRHRHAVERFGRFPHRNEILGRKTTPQERAALDSEEISF